MALLWLACWLWVGGGAIAFVLQGRAKASAGVALVSLVGGAGLAAWPAVEVLRTGVNLWALMPWALPLGLGATGLDPLSALFLLVLLVVATLAGVYGVAYLAPERRHRVIGATWLPFHVLVAAMVMLLIARDGMVFLLAWEMMTLASFMLVVFDHHLPAVRRAAVVYLIAGHVGAAALMAMFLVLDDGSGTLLFGAGGVVGSPNVVFLLALIGFGTKAGLFPLHVWLPEAHAAAPSHVSALMSGVMLKMGVYGLLRVLPWLGAPRLAWGVTLLLLGAVSAVVGVLYALAQDDLKRLLAYSSVDNVGLIVMALGLALIGMHQEMPVLVWLATMGALLHVVNHAVFKSLLFMGAGAVLRGTGTRQLEALGGLVRRMPAVGHLFLVGVMAVCALPPLNGFVSELFMYMAALQGVLRGEGLILVATLSALVVLAGVGGLTLLCFAKAYGIAFLGEARSAAASEATAPGVGMWAPMLVLALLALSLGLGASWSTGWVGSLVSHETGVTIPALEQTLARMLAMVSVLAGGGLVLVLVLLGLRRRLAPPPLEARELTWDCGYTAPTSRMQYSGASLVQPVRRDFGWLLGLRRQEVRGGDVDVGGLFPRPTLFASKTPDWVLERLWVPALAGLGVALRLLRRFQRGRVQVYILYILVTLILLLIYQVEA